VNRQQHWHKSGVSVHSPAELSVTGPKLAIRDEIDPDPELLELKKAMDGKKEKVFDALEWLAAMSSHVPDKGEQMVRYYGYYNDRYRKAIDCRSLLAT